jgi:YD repeat-containing protein
MNNFQVRIRADGGTRDLLFTLPNGNVERFKDAQDNDRTTGTSRGYRVLAREELGRFRVFDEDITWTFGPGGTLERVDDASGDWVEVEYDQHARLASTTGPDGPGLLFEISPDDRLTRVTTASDPTDFVRYEYDAAGRLVRAVHSSGFGQRFAYDGDTQLITEISDDEGTVLLVLEYADGYSVVRERDAQGLVDGEAVTYEYEELPDGGVRTTVIYPPSLVEPTWHPVQRALHDSQGRLLELELQPTSDETLIGKYAYDPENRRIVLEDPCPRELVNPFEAMLTAFWQLFLLLLGVPRL